MYLENDPKKKHTTLKKGDHCTFNKERGRASFSRRGVPLSGSKNEAIYPVHLGYPVLIDQIMKMIAESHGFGYEYVERRGDEEIYRFI